MENLNKIPVKGLFKDIANFLNANFTLIKEALEEMLNKQGNDKGIYSSAEALQAAYPSPQVGNRALVGAASPFTVYQCETDGLWKNTGITESHDINLNEYAKKTEVEAAVAGITVETVNSLEETTPGKALDATQGKALADRIETLSETNKSIGKRVVEFSTDAATTRLQIVPADRKEGFMLSYKNSDGEWVNEQYAGTSLLDDDWKKEENWVKGLTPEYVKDTVVIGKGLMRASQIITYKDSDIDFGNNIYILGDAVIGKVFPERVSSSSAVTGSLKITVAAGETIKILEKLSTYGVFSGYVITDSSRVVTAVGKAGTAGTSFNIDQDGFIYLNFTKTTAESYAVHTTLTSYLSNSAITERIKNYRDIDVLDNYDTEYPDGKLQVASGALTRETEEKASVAVQRNELSGEVTEGSVIALASAKVGQRYTNYYYNIGGNNSYKIPVGGFKYVDLTFTPYNKNIGGFIAINDKSEIVYIYHTSEVQHKARFEIGKGWAFIIVNSIASAGAEYIGIATSYIGRDEIIDNISESSERSVQSSRVTRDLWLASALYDNSVTSRLKETHPFFGLLLAASSKYFSLDNIKLLLDNMAAAGLNKFIYFFGNDRGLRFALDDMTVNANGTTYDLTPALGDGISWVNGNPDGSNKYLTQTEVSDMISYANGLGIEVIGCLDMPNHTGAILEHFPQFKGTTDAMLDISNGKAVNFLTALLEKYASFFAGKRCKRFCFGADEVPQYYKGTSYLAGFINLAARTILQNGLVPMAFNDNINVNGIGPMYISRSIEVIHWWNWNKVKDLVDGGFRVINANGAAWYWVLGNSAPDISKFRNPDGRTWHNNQYHQANAGVIMSLWTDKGDTDGQDDGSKMISDTAPYVEAFGEGCKENSLDWWNIKYPLTSVGGGFMISPGEVRYVDIKIQRVIGFANCTINKDPRLQFVNFTNIDAYGMQDGVFLDGTLRIWFTNVSDVDISVPTNPIVDVSPLKK